MKACVLENINELVYKEVPLPLIKSDEVLLRIKSCGICSSDVDRIRRTGTYQFPTIPGHEFSGEIIDVGKNVDKNIIGKKATVFPLLPCKKCNFCQIGLYELCEDYSYFGSRCNGGFAEYIAVPEWNLVLVDDAMDFDVAALSEPASVAFHAVDQLKISLGQRIAIIGTGTIGIISAIWILHSGGIPIIVGNDDRKKEFISQLGIEFRLDTEIDNMFADAALECVGTSDSISTALSCVDKMGTVIVVGNPADNINLDRQTWWSILRKEINLKGVWNSSYNPRQNDWKIVTKFLVDNQEIFKKLITHKFPMQDLELGLNLIEKHKELVIKVMMKNY